MLIARAPVRISFAGGGTDFEAYYAEHGGMVVSATIDKYFYVFPAPDQGAVCKSPPPTTGPSTVTTTATFSSGTAISVYPRQSSMSSASTEGCPSSWPQRYRPGQVSAAPARCRWPW